MENNNDQDASIAADRGDLYLSDVSFRRELCQRALRPIPALAGAAAAAEAAEQYNPAAGFVRGA